MSDYPPFLQVGTEISAKFKGAFCEAKIKKATRCVKCRVVFKDIQIPSTVLDENVIRGSIRLGVSVEAPHPDTKQMMPATIQQIKDCSTYTVVFDDGDEKVLRRSQMCLKGGRHFDESESLDVMPLTKPEQFGAPVRSKLGKKLKNSSDSDSDDCERSSNVDKKSVERRSTRQTPVPPPASSVNSANFSANQADFGRVVCVFEDSQTSTTNKTGVVPQEKRRWYPAMIVSPNAQQGIKLKPRDDYLIRSFKDGKYQVVSRSLVQDFNIDKAKKIDLPSLKPAVEKAILYLEKDELPVHWDRELLMGDPRMSPTDDSSCDDAASDQESKVGRSEGGSSFSSRPIVSEKKDRFVAQLYKYMDELGTPINKAPTLAQKDLDLYRLFESVRKLGGYNRVCLKNEWKSVLKKLKLDGLPGATPQSVKSAFNKYLSQFENFYRKLGCQMDETSRRERHASKTAAKINDKVRKFNDKAIENDLKSKEEISSVNKKPFNIMKRTAASKFNNSPSSSFSSKQISSSSESPKVAVTSVVATLSPEKTTCSEPEPSLGGEIEIGNDKSFSEENNLKSSEQQQTSLTDEAESAPAVNEELAEFKIGQKLRVQYGSGPQIKIYMAKVMKIEPANRYLVHYLGWNNRYDEIIDATRVVEVLPEESSDVGGVESPTVPPQTKPKGVRGGGGGHKPVSTGRLPMTESKSALFSSRKRRSSGGSTHSLPIETSSLKKYKKREVNLCQVKKELTEEIESILNNNSEKWKINSSCNNNGGRRSANCTPIPPQMASEEVSVKVPPVKERKRKSATVSSTDKKVGGGEEDDDSNDSEETTVAAVRRVSKRLRGEKPIEVAKKLNVTQIVEKEEEILIKDCVKNEITEEVVEEENENTVKTNNKPSSVASLLLATMLTAEPSSSEVVLKLKEPQVTVGSTSVQNGPEQPDEENEVKNNDCPAEEKTEKPTKVIENVVIEQESKEKIVVPAKRAPPNPMKRNKPKRRRRNYSHMVTDHRKSTKSTPKKDAVDSDNETGTKCEGSPKDPNSLQALRHKVQMEMDQDPNYKPFYTFNVIDETLDSDKKLQVLQQRLIEVKEAYAQVKSEWAYLERKRKKHLEKKRNE